MTVHDTIVYEMASELARHENVTRQHLIAVALDRLFVEAGLPPVASSMDWDERAYSIPNIHDDVVLGWGGAEDSFAVRVGSRRKKFEVAGQKVFARNALYPSVAAKMAFVLAMAAADKEMKEAMASEMAEKRGGKEVRLLEVELAPEERVDVECVRLSDGAVVASRKKGVLGYVGPGGTWGEWHFSLAQDALVWRGPGPGPEHEVGEWLYSSKPEGTSGALRRL